MANSTDKICHFFAKGRCRNGISCRFLHPGTNQEDTIKRMMKQMNKESEKKHEAQLAREREIEMKKLNQKMKEYEERRRREVERIQQSEEKRLLDISSWGPNWQKKCKALRETLRGIFHDSLLILMAEYCEDQELDRNHFWVSRNSSWVFRTKGHKCRRCETESNLWMVMLFKKEIAKIGYPDMEYQIMCSHCAGSIDEFSNAKTNQDVYIDILGHPIINWNKRMTMEWDANSWIIPTNDIARLKFVGISEECILMQLSKINPTITLTIQVNDYTYPKILEL
jgi:hypothetical protein